MKPLNNMNLLKYHKIIVMLLAFGTLAGTANAQDSTVAKPELVISYFLPVNKVPYLEVMAKRKVGRKFEPVKNVAVKVYFNTADTANLLGQVVTAENGKARVGFPASFRSTWDSLDEFTFAAVGTQAADHDPLTADVTVKKAILTVDTTSEDGTRMVVASLKEKTGNDWVAVKDIDMKLSVKRLLGNLSVGDEETYTSDSTGLSSAEFKRDSMPGDQKGNITLVAKVDDNDTYGTLVAEKTVAWGTAVKPASNFFAQRTLWSTRFETPIWLLAVAYSVVISVWSTIIYLIFQLVKIKKLNPSKKLQTNR